MIAIKAQGVCKAFGPNEVLRDISFTLPAGQVTVLMGANGAGKSTLVKILSGVHSLDRGSLCLFDSPYAPVSPRDAMASAVVTVHQSIDEGVIPDLDIASNLLLEQLARGNTGFWLRRSSLHARARELTALVGLDAPVDTPVHTLSLADRQRVAIARAMSFEPKVLILDEPTSSLSANEADRLFELIDRLRSEGVAILYISHRMSDIRRISDRIITLRDGQISGLFEEQPLDLPAAVNAMLGRIVDDAVIEPVSSDAPAFQMTGVSLRPDSVPFDLTLHKGEVVAVCGLVGSGKTALGNALFGLEKPNSGTMMLAGRPYAPRSTGEAVTSGVFLCPKDRARNAVIPDFDLAGNMSLPFLKHYSSLSWLSRTRERRKAATSIEELDVVCQSYSDQIGTLSGGNQQKVMVARWLAEPCQLLVLDEPFQGVDIQARRDIGNRLRRTAPDRGTLVLVSEIDEALEIADRIIVISEHTLVNEHLNRDVDLDRLLQEVAAAQPHSLTVQPSAP